MNLLKKFLLGVHDSWSVVMDAKINPLKYLPDRSLQAYFMIVLFVMWSAFFALIAAYWGCLLYTSPSPRDIMRSRMPSSA